MGASHDVHVVLVALATRQGRSDERVAVVTAIENAFDGAIVERVGEPVRVQQHHVAWAEIASLALDASPSR